MGHQSPTERRRPTPAAPRYWVVQRLGCGGMAVVYDAIDVRTSRRVALKVLRNGRTDPTAARAALEREAVAMRLAAGPSVCRAFGVTECCGHPCLVMERLIGRTLQARLAAGRMNIAAAIDAAAQIAQALHTIHRAGLIHSDIKPANVFISGCGRIKVVDFGLATRIDASDGRNPHDRHAAHEVLGTASYVAPERILRAAVDERSDLFSLGAVLYEMAFGRSPFAAATSAQAIFNVLEREPPAVAIEGAHAVAVDRLARRLLEKNPARRCRSAAEVRRILVELQKDRPRGARAATVNRSIQTRGISHAFLHAEAR